MKKRIAALLLAGLAMLVLTACQTQTDDGFVSELVSFTDEETNAAGMTEETLTITETEAEPEAEEETTSEAPALTEAAPEPETTDYLPPEDEPLPVSVEKDGSYTSSEDVAEYIHTFGTLPGNFLTKKEAQKLGWVSSEGNLWDVAPGMSIGGDYFGNREGILPDGDYRECDINYEGGFRGAERIIFGTDGSIWYTNDHYKSFTQLY